MPVMKIPDSVLEKLRCQCGQYLSKAPVNIQDGKSLCGDCVDRQDPTPAAIVQNSPYEALANLFAFPCRYKPQGCPKYMEFNKVESHLSECSYRIYHCPVNFHTPCNKKGTTSELFKHYETQHADLYLESPSFRIELDHAHEAYRFFKLDGILLLLQTKCSVEEGKLWFSMVCFREMDSLKLINYTIKLSNGHDGQRTMQLERRSPVHVANIGLNLNLSMHVDIGTVLNFLEQNFVECYWDIEVSEELKNIIKDQNCREKRELYEISNESIKCSSCNFYMVPSIARCAQNHVICLDCRGYGEECKICQKGELTFTPALDLDEITKAIRRYCKWIKCQSIFSHSEIREHEQNCVHRIYRCPHCHFWFGILDKLVEHFKSMHSEIELHVKPSIGFSAGKHFSAYAVACKEMFRIDASFEDKITDLYLNIKILYFGLPTLSNNWKFEVTGDQNLLPGSFLQNMNLYSSSVKVAKKLETHTPMFSNMKPTIGNPQNAFGAGFNFNLSGLASTRTQPVTVNPKWYTLVISKFNN